MTKKILVVDDEAHIRSVLELKFKSAGYEVRGFANGIDALEGAKEFMPDLIVSDYKMPGGISGVDLIHGVRQTPNLFHTPIILLTGSVAFIQKLNQRLDGVEGITMMSKPFSPRNLITKASEILGDCHVS
jgi:CheY-like chemotaxis protein